MVESTTESTIRPARVADAETLAHVAAQAFRDGWADVITLEYANLYIVRSLTLAKIAEEIADVDNHFYLVAVNGDDTPVGFAKLNLTRPAPALVTGPAPMLMQRLYVAADHRGTGVADRLFQEIVAEARRRGAKTVWLECDRRNARAWRFYEKRGWHDMGISIFYADLPDGRRVVINDQESVMQKTFTDE